MTSLEIEEQTDRCPYCGNPVISLWVKGGGCLSSPDYVLVADWIFHSSCWDRQVEEHPP